MKRIEFRIDTFSRRLIFAAAALVLAAAFWYIGKWGLANMVSLLVDRTDVADLAVEWAPNDPQTHYAAAVLYDRTFLPTDEARSLEEFERSVALAPDNYLIWLEYGKALSRSGDNDRAEAALRQAQSLAPNYSLVKWTLGNTLVRDGKVDEGFAEIRDAVIGDPTYASPAVTLAYAYFQGDLAKIQSVVGDSAAAKASLAAAMANDKRYDDATAVWNSIPADSVTDQLASTRDALVNELLSAKKFGLAWQIARGPGDQSGQISDGGFENAITLDNAPVFDWQISPGAQPQVLQSTRQPHGGSKSLVLLFNSNDGSGLRQMSQTVVVKPGKFTLQGFYHSDLKSSAPLIWQVVDGSTGKPIAEMPIKDASADWRQFAVSFDVPPDTDGVIVRLTVGNCGSAICPINGSIWFDDLSLAKT